MQVLHECCAGLDVHKDTVVACALWTDGQGHRRQEVRTFSTFTGELQSLGRWMASKGITHVAMESTGVYWKPVFNILEADFEVVLVNAQYLRRVPGRKTDVLDCQWIADLLQHGLLRASYIPPLEQRQLRDLTRQRAQLVGEHTRIANRIQKVLEDANIKLASVVSDVMGVSGRDMLAQIVKGQEDPKALADLARRRLRGKIPQLELALRGHLTEHHRFMLKMLLEHLRQLEELIAQFDGRIEEKVLPFAKALERLETIPGVKSRVAQDLMAEIGPDLASFPSPAALASWAGMCPGNRQTGPKRGSGKVRKANRWLRRCLNQGAWAAGHTKNTYLSSQFHRLARRRGKKRAIVAVGHSILTMAYYILKEHQTYRELGADFFDHLHPERLTRHFVRRLERLGYTVTLQRQDKAA